MSFLQQIFYSPTASILRRFDFKGFKNPLFLTFLKYSKINQLITSHSNNFPKKCTVVQNKESLSKRWVSKIWPFSIRNQLGDTQIPKISQKCRGKLCFLIYFWFLGDVGKLLELFYIDYIGGVFKWIVIAYRIFCCQ